MDFAFGSVENRFIYKIEFISSIQSTIVMLTNVGFIVMQKDKANLLLGVLKNGR
jgi:hypothetical protein